MDEQVQGWILWTSCKQQDDNTIQLTKHLN
jgi:hypothetical protein